MTQAYTTLFTAALLILGALMIACLVRAIMGPRIADRLVSINMMGAIAIMIIALLSVMLDEGYLVDIAIIYAMLSFLAVVVLVKVFIGIYMANRQKGGAGQ